MAGPSVSNFILMAFVAIPESTHEKHTKFRSRTETFNIPLSDGLITFGENRLLAIHLYMRLEKAV
jgi:hypothetical protein